MRRKEKKNVRPILSVSDLFWQNITLLNRSLTAFSLQLLLVPLSYPCLETPSTSPPSVLEAEPSLSRRLYEIACGKADVALAGVTSSSDEADTAGEAGSPGAVWYVGASTQTERKEAAPNGRTMPGEPILSNRKLGLDSANAERARAEETGELSCELVA